LRRRLRGRRFDVLLDMQVSLRASLASLAVGARERYGFDRQRSREGHGLFCNRRIEPQRYAHVVDGFAAFARAIGVAEVPARCRIPVSDVDADWAANRVPDGSPVLAIVPSASAAERNWTAEGYGRVADHAAGAGCRVLLLGGPGKAERRLADRVTGLMTARPVDLVGKTTLKQLLALISRSAVLLAPDTGPVHLAVSAGVPVIGLYCHSNPRRTGPYGGMEWVVNHYDRIIARQRGRPWTDLPWGARAKGDGLMQEIRVNEVISTFDRLVEEKALLR
jgi:heptosyltransferase I